MLKSSPNAKTPRYDVAILGSGIGGTILGAILARHGVRVLLLEESVHPRFTIGESTISETTVFFRLLAARYHVPEIEHLANHQLLRRHVGTAHGAKRNFSFMVHRMGEPQRPHECTQFPTTAPPLGPDIHFFRQDIDAYMMSVAVSYGAAISQRTPIESVDFEGDAVRIKSKDGREFIASFLIDAGGLRSWMAQRFGLRQNPCPLKTRSRTIFTHMVGVRPYDAILGGPEVHGLPSPVSEGTLHHLFKGGWMWVIPFNNHTSSTNRLVSVGINLDVDMYPRTDIPPEQEFWSFVRSMPSIAAQFERATAVREWTGTDRIQFSSTRSIGERFAMLPHAFSFIDPLYSSGLGVTMAAINALACRLIKASRDGDYSVSRFEYVDEWTKRNFAYYDRLVSGSYTSFGSFPVWNAWTRLWMIGALLGAFGVFELLVKVRQSSHDLPAEEFETFPYRGAQGSEFTPFAQLSEAAEQELDVYRANGRSAEETSERIFSLVRESGLWPDSWGKLDPERRHTGTFRLVPILKAGMWFRKHAPELARQYYFVRSKPSEALLEAAKEVVIEFKHSGGTFVRMLRDYFIDYNEDWKPVDEMAMQRTLPPSDEPEQATSPVTASTQESGTATGRVSVGQQATPQAAGGE